MPSPETGYKPPLMSPEVFRGVTTSLMEARDQRTNNLKLPSQVLRPIFDRAMTMHVSGEGSHKYRNFAHAAGLVENGQIAEGALYSVPNPRFDEDDMKEPIAEILGKKLDDPRMIALCKADRQLSTDPETRHKEIVAILGENLTDQELTNALFKPLILSAGNDVMVYISTEDGQEIPMFKPNLHLPEDEKVKKALIFNYLNGFFMKLPEVFTITAKAGTTLLDMRTNLGVVAGDKKVFAAHRPSMDMLYTLILGITDHTPPRLAEVFLEVAKRFPEIDGWTPENGLEFKYILGVNGGIRTDHPLWIMALNYDRDGVEISAEHFDFERFTDRVEDYQKILRGYPTRLYEATLALIERILVEKHGQEISNQKITDLTFEQQDILAKLAANGIQPTGDWAAIQFRKSGEVTQIHEEVERLQRLAAIHALLESQYHAQAS